jgi:hypothetical protein
VSYLARITKSSDQFLPIRIVVEDKELVSISLNGLVSWRPFVQGVCARDKLPNFTKLWDDLVQEEIGLDSCSVKQEEVEEVALVGRTKKRSKKGYSKAKKEGSNSGKKDLSKLKCFRCH